MQASSLPKIPGSGVVRIIRRTCGSGPASGVVPVTPKEVKAMLKLTLLGPGSGAHCEGARSYPSGVRVSELQDVVWTTI